MLKKVHRKIKQFIEANKLLEGVQELILGVSGGADSMMLLHYFYEHQNEYGVTLKVAHVHHGMREEATLDAELVEERCKELKLPFYRYDCNIKELAKTRTGSEEEIAREERYNFFISLLNEGARIVTAHNMNDQAETMLMRFIRGTDIKGLGGIPSKRDSIIRPLLCITRKEIEAYCQEGKINYRHDETNFMPIYTRNKIRLECMPYVQQHINPSVVRVLGEHSQLYQEEEAFLESHTMELFKHCAKVATEEIRLESSYLLSYPVYMQRRIWMKAISLLVGGLKDITTKHLNSCLALGNLQSGKEVHLPHQLVVRKVYQELILTKVKKQDSSFCKDLDIGSQVIKEIGVEVSLSLIPKDAINLKIENLYTKYIDYGKIKSGLQIRTRRSSDFIRLSTGTKTLKKLFIDDKISKDMRDNIPLIADGDEIIWVAGSRLNIDYYVTPNTQKVLEIRMTKEN